jgi:hypothetical protein
MPSPTGHGRLQSKGGGPELPMMGSASGDRDLSQLAPPVPSAGALPNDAPVSNPLTAQQMVRKAEVRCCPIFLNSVSAESHFLKRSIS